MQVRDRPKAKPSPGAQRQAGGTGVGRRVRGTRPEPPAWRAALLCAGLIAAFAMLAYAITVTRGNDGVGEFYALPAKVRTGQAGELIKVERLDPKSIGGDLFRVMYHSRSVSGGDVAVTGSVAIPRTPAPIGGRPVLTVGHQTLGNGDECAPSRDPWVNADVINKFLGAGWIVATSDYEGLGTPGVPPYLVGESEGRSMVDIVRAVHSVPAFDASATFAAWGHSQGGHAALFARKVAATWAPDLRMVGAVAVAPVSSATTFISRANFAGPGLTLMTVAGYAAAYGLDPREVLTTDGMDHLEDADKECLADLGDELGDRTLSDIRKVDPTTLGDWGQAIARNDAGPIRSNVAVLLLQGDEDAIVPPSDTEGLFTQMCSTSQPVTLQIDHGGGHADVRDRTIDQAVNWLTDRFDLTPDASNCPKPAG